MVADVLRKPAEMPELRHSSGRAEPARAARWLVCASGKGGTGKTTTALNLATIAAAAGLRVALVDMDDQQTLSEWHGLRPEGVLDLQLLTIPLVDVGRAIREVGAMAGFDLVIVDTPPGLDQRVRLRELVQHADFVLVPTTQGPGDIRSVTEFMATLKALRVKAAFLLNRTNQRWGSYREARRKLNKAGPLCPVDVRQLRDIEATNSYGVGINEFDRAKGAEDLEAVWDFVREVMGL
ncbi:MAG TPA: ParA family protein [Afifellaceae bacterium]|nr:ParA family protein [Afifellaceae bacterium]